MMKKILFFLWGSSIILLFAHCSSKPSLQQYFVEKMDDSSFLVVNVPLNLNSMYTDSLQAEDLETIRSIRKLNVLILQSKGVSEARYQTELETITRVLAYNQFDKLMEFRAFQTNGSILLQGDPSDIDEGVLWIQDPKYGFALIRVLGNKINPQALVELAQKMDPDKFDAAGFEQFGPLREIFDNLSQEGEKEEKTKVTS